MKPLSPLQQVLDAAVAAVPKKIVVDLVQKKLRALGVERPGLDEALADHILSRAGEPFEFDDDLESVDLNLELAFGADDAAEVEKRVADFEKGLPELVNGLVDSAAKNILKGYQRNWPNQRSYEQSELAGFSHRLDGRWGGAIDSLRMLLTISREISEEEYAKFSKSRAKKSRVKREVLFQLHARACQITSEITLLLSAGYADGAFARWRTLHEIATVAQLIFDHGDELAQRYLDHEAIECDRGAKIYEQTHKALGFRPLPKRESKRIDAAVQQMVAKYGADFRSEYGWASHLLKNKNPKFIHLEQAAGRSRMRSHYKMASQNVHAGVMGITRKLGLLGRESLLVVGPSNAGLEEPDLARRYRPSPRYQRSRRSVHQRSPFHPAGR